MDRFMKYILMLIVCLTSMLPISTEAELRTPENVPITFYGKVVDEDGKPLAGAKVSLVVVTSHFAENRTDQEPVALETDQSGNFTLTGVTAYAIDEISIQKHGYELSQKAKRGYKFGSIPDDYKPDSANPVVFKMWKHQHPEPLIVGSKFYGVIPDGQPNTIDFLQQKKKDGISPPGDIVVRINRPANLQPGTRFDWSFSIESIDGGVIHTEDDFLYRAPILGYQKKYDFKMSATNSYRYSNQQFYLKSRNGQVYGRLTVEVIPDYKDQGVFNVQYFINTNGSQNLEYDKKAETRKHLSHPEKMPPSDYP